MTEHTGGEWVARLNHGGAWTIQMEGDPETSPVIASRSQWTHRAVESYANALVMAAAPKMLVDLARHEDSRYWAGKSTDEVIANLAERYGITPESAAAAVRAAREGR